MAETSGVNETIDDLQRKSQSERAAAQVHEAAAAAGCVYYARQTGQDHLYRQGKGAEKPRQPVLRLTGRTFRESAPHGGKCRSF